MKQVFLTLLCMAVAAGLLAQEKYPTPTPTADQKFKRAVNQYWSLTAAAINQAKANGITPYDYGKSIGKLYAPTWRNPDFDGFVKGMLWNFEMFRAPQEKQAVAKENSDGSVTLSMDDKVIHGFFANKPFNVTYDEVLDYYKGITEVFASDIIQGKTSYKHQDSVLLYTFKRQ
jgi:hypothetical protein